MARPARGLSVFVLIVCSIVGVESGRGAEDVATSQREAVAAFPELGRAGSPLHRKFMELYAKAKANKAPVLLKPDWPLVIGKEAAAALGVGAEKREASPAAPPSAPTLPAASPSVGPTLPRVSDGSPPPPEPIKLQPLRLYVPSSESPEGSPDGRTPEQVRADWQKKKAHAVMLPAQIFDSGKGYVPSDIPPPSPEPNLWRTLAQLYRARKDGDLEAAKALVVPEARKAIGFEAKGKSAIEQPPEVPLVVEIHGNIVVFIREGSTITPLTVLVRAGEYRVAPPNPWEPEDRRLLFDLTDFLEKQPATGLLAK